VPGAFADAERYGALAEADAALRPWTPTRPRRSARRRSAARSGSLRRAPAQVRQARD